MARPSKGVTFKDFGLSPPVTCHKCGGRVRSDDPAGFERLNDGTVVVTCQPCMWDMRLWAEQFEQGRTSR